MVTSKTGIECHRHRKCHIQTNLRWESKKYAGGIEAHSDSTQKKQVFLRMQTNF
jgi:hypothetical protein